MDPVHIFYSELKVNKGNIFTENIAKENEVEKVIFDKNKEYAKTGLKIKPEIAETELVEVKTTKELDRISKEIHEITKTYEEPNLALSISNSETKTVSIPFVKKQ